MKLKVADSQTYGSVGEKVSLYQRYAWGELKKTDIWDDVHRYVIEEEGQFVASVQFLEKKMPFLGRFLYAPGGPTFHRAFDLVDEVFSTLADFLDEENVIFARASPRQDLGAEKNVLIQKNGFQPAVNRIFFESTFRIDLTQSLEDLKSDLHSSWRRSLRKSKVEVRAVAWKDYFECFYSMLEETANRKGFNQKPKDVILERRKQFGKDAKLFMAFTPQGDVSAGAIVIVGEDRAWIDRSASRSEHFDLKPNQGLHWFILKWLKDRGVKVYDRMGAPYNPEKDNAMYGVYKFKQQMGGQQIKYPGEFDYVNAPVIHFIWERSLPYYRDYLEELGI